MHFDAFLSGVVAGYGIAIPIGPISILILELGLRRGVRVALSAGGGAATADLIYATTAALAGSFLVSVLAPFAFVLRIVSGLGLVAIGILLLYKGRSSSNSSDTSRFSVTSCPQTYGIFLGLTLLNPLTVAYFTTLILGMGTGSLGSTLDATLFISGAFLASLSWASLIASAGGLAHKRLPTNVQTITFIIGNSVVIALGIMIFLGFRI